MSIVEQFRYALGRLTCLPVRSRVPAGGIVEATTVLPLVGLIVGFLVALVFALSFYFGLNSFLSALIAAIALTGLHAGRPEHGLCRFVEALPGPGPEARLLRLRGETLGAPAVIALVAMFLLRAAALTALGAPMQVFNGLIAATTLGLAMVAFATYMLPSAIGFDAATRPGESGAGEAERDRPDPVELAWALLIGAIVAVLALGFGTALAACLAAIAASLAVLALAQARLNGRTDEVLGAVQVSAEIAALLAAIAVVGAVE
ncbi:MAG: adenosylcobinamide-GDP ribazoletransferase [Alphaproteobacteria bacterium]|nr:adenosylcobinamide-GDP ribazoletransferase [Alphaproteobacteria bacterium]